MQPTYMHAWDQSNNKLMEKYYNYLATQNNGRMVSSSDTVNGQTVNYTYDVLNRLTVANAGSAWADQYIYNGSGNLTGKMPTQSPAPAMSAVYDANNHQIGLSYDANSNQLGDSQHATAYT